MRRVLVLALTLGCHSGGSVHDAGKRDAALDGASAIDASLCRLLGPDAGMYDGPGCGCAIGDRACQGCFSPHGPCESCGAAMGCESQVAPNQCDGPEDCPSQICCVLATTYKATACATSLSDCQTNTIRCHPAVPNTCGSGETCCANGSGGTCMPSC